MSDEIPSGWYPDAQGTIRWWDGDQWTDHVREPEPEPTPAEGTAVMATAEPEPEIPAVPEPVTSAPAATTAPAPVKRSWETEDDTTEDDADRAATRRLWLTATAVGLAAFFLGLGIGSRGDEPTPEPSVTSAATSSPELDQLRADLDQRQSELDQREQALDDRENDLESATPTPSPTESDSTYLDDTIDNETVKVGTDVEAGRYETQGPDDTTSDCEYTVSRDEAGNDVIHEDTTSSSTSVTLNDGQYFTSDNCMLWEKQ
jgi:hypothetical protein